MKNLLNIFDSSNGGMTEWLKATKNFTDNFNKVKTNLEKSREFTENFIKNPVETFLDIPNIIENNIQEYNVNQEKDNIIEEVIFNNENQNIKYNYEILHQNSATHICDLVYKIYLAGCNITNTNIDIINNTILIKNSGKTICTIYPRVMYDLSTIQTSLIDGILTMTMSKIKNSIKLEFNI
jgi:hypothetical protein